VTLSAPPSRGVGRLAWPDVKHRFGAHGDRRPAEIVQDREGVLAAGEHLVELIHHVMRHVAIGHTLDDAPKAGTTG
jgi:hypothetical protein